MPLEVVDLRSDAAASEVLTRHHGGWDRPDLAKAAATVRRILGDVREDGDEAVLSYTASFDGVELDPDGLRVSVAERDEAASRIDERTMKALHAAADALREYHEAQRPQDWSLDRDGASVGQVFRPIRRVGLYAPGGRGAYPSTVLHTAVPATVAGVPEIVLCTPPDPSGSPADVILAAAQVAGITEIYRIGGAQAVGALAYGTATVRAVDKICGPGNIYVTLAKREVFGTVGIDGLFGPSEAVVVTDAQARASFAAAELLTQAEHDPEAAAVLVTTSEELLAEILRELWDRLRRLPRAAAIREALANHGLAVLVRDLEQAAEVVDELAPEHLCIHTSEPQAFLDRVHAAGTVLVGADTPATLSDYCAGPSHVLPTARTARFSSGLSVRDFLVALNTVSYSRQALFRDASIAETIAETEGLQAHREDLHVRLEEGPG
ncbi:MAG TPA: histidinol dehydrogenase [Actinomycetota bacterium]|nr:histidinol dehydrogenase [Actinomycetota bacterium]